MPRGRRPCWACWCSPSAAAFRRIPASARCWLWLVVLIRLLVPLAPQSAFSLFNLARLPAAVAEPTRVEPVPARIEPTLVRSDMEAKSEDSQSFLPRIESQSAAAAATQRALPTETSAPKQSSWLLVLTVSAVLGIGFLSCRGIVTAIHLRRTLRRCRPVTDGHLTALLESCRIQSGLHRPINLLVTDLELAPALAGVLTPKIIVSRSTQESLGLREFRWLFRHELAHVRRRDVLSRRLWSLARTLHWFNPLVWWASSRAQFEAELACDEWVVGRVPEREQIDYARALVNTAELLMTQRRPLSGAVGLLAREPALSKRVRAIASYKRQSRRARLAGAAVILCLGRSRFDRCGRTAEPQATAEPAPAAATSTAEKQPGGGSNPGAAVVPPSSNPDGRPHLAAMLDAWERGHQLLSSYDLYLTCAEQVRRVGPAAKGRLAFAPTTASRVMHAVRDGKRNRIEYGVGEPGQKPDRILVWDGNVARTLIPADGTITVSERPDLGCLDLEHFYRDCTSGTDTIDFLRKRADTVVERADAKAVVLYLPPTSTYGLRIWLDPAKNFLPARIERLNGVGEALSVDFKQENTLEEFAPGIWAPAKIAESRYARVNESATFEVVITVNHKASRFHAVPDDSAFRLTVPPGTMVFDRIVDARYRLGKANTPAEQVSQQAIEGKITATQLKDYAEKSGITAQLRRASQGANRTAGKNRVPLRQQLRLECRSILRNSRRPRGRYEFTFWIATASPCPERWCLRTWCIPAEKDGPSRIIPT